MDYEELRNKNIAERRALFSDFFQELGEKTSDLKHEIDLTRRHTGYRNSTDIENEPPKKRRRMSDTDSSVYKTSARLKFRKKYNTRSRARQSLADNVDNDNDDDNDDDNDNDNEKHKKRKRKRESLKIIFPFAKTFQRELEVENMNNWDWDKDISDYSSSSNESDSDYSSKKRKRAVINKVTKSVYDPTSIPTPDEITAAMLSKVAQKSSLKKYCAVNGTTCHQCRQKTMDTKTVCRSGECIGVRGQFCGPCLYLRYGEDATIVLKDPTWACPVCRGLCNCSICRTRKGQVPTGILAPLAQEEGYKSVMDYLKATSGDEDEASESES